MAIHPSDFTVPPEQAITSELNKKYSNRVLHDLGLCVSVFDLSQVGEGKVRYGDGFLWYTGINVQESTKFQHGVLSVIYSHLPTGRIQTVRI